MDPAPLPIPNGLVKIWIQYEYFKRNSIEVTQKSICEAVFSPDDETAGLVSAAWQPAPDPAPAPDPDPDAEPEAKRPKPNPIREETEKDWDILITQDNNFTDLRGISNFKRGEQPERTELPPEVVISAVEREQFMREFRPFDVDRFQKWPTDDDWWTISDHGHDHRLFRCRDSCEIQAITALYNKFAEKEIKFFEKKRGSLEDTDIIQLLACRENCEKDEKMLLDKIKLPIRKMKIVTDYWKTKVEIYRDPESEKHLNFQFWRHEEGCLFWTEGENVRLIRKRAYQEVAAEYVVTVMKHPKMKFKELIFDIEPWYKGPAEFPNLQFYKQLEEQLKSALDKKRVKVRHLFMRSCFSNYQVDQFSLVVPYLRRKWLKLITLRIWDDTHVDEREKKKRKAYSVDYRLMGIPNEEGWIEMPKAWKSATHLDYRDENLPKFPIKWYDLTTFQSIQMLDVHWEAFEDISDAFMAFPPRQRCTINVENKLNLKNIKWNFSNIDGIELPQGFAKFKSSTRRTFVMIKLQDRKIIIDIEKNTDHTRDDKDYANETSDDESWTDE